MGLFRNWCAFFLLMSLVPYPGRGQSSFPGLKFIENKNQWPPSVDFAARTPAGRLMVSPGQFSLHLFDPEKFNKPHVHEHGDAEMPEGDDAMIRGHHIRISFPGAEVPSQPVAYGKSAEYHNFFLGNDSSKWASHAYAYDEIVYPSLYSGVDLRISSVGDNLKYDFIVKAGADPSVVRIEFAGADQVEQVNGNLMIHTSVGTLLEKKPFTYQVINGQKCEVPSEYHLDGSVVSFLFPDGYESCEQLIIDPLLIFSTFSGSTADNWGSTATPGENGMLYSSGITTHLNVGGTFPATPGAFQTVYGGNYDIAILKYDSTGGQRLYASYLGGSSNDTPHSLVMDTKTKDLIVLGTSSSLNFPITSGTFGKFYKGGLFLQTSVFEFQNGSDIVVSRISSSGDKLLASTFLGGSSNDGINPTGSPLVRNYGDELRGDVITDTLGNVYVSSVTTSPDFPAINSFSTEYKGGATDAVLVKIAPYLSQIVWSAFIGGSGYDAAHTLKFDSAYNIYLAGGTDSPDFPVTAGSYQPVYAGSTDGWIAMVKADGSAIEYATFTGTPNFDQVYFVDLDAAGDVYVYGQTNGNFPVTAGTYSNPNSGQFVQKLSGDLSQLVFSTVFGSGIGFPNISPTAFLVNECNNIYMAGWGGNVNISRGFWPGTTQGMPVTADALQKTTRGSDFYFIVLTSDASELLYATYFGGNQSAIHVDGGTSRFDRKGIVYHAVCAGCGGGFDDFPTTPGAWSRTNNSGNCNNAAFKFDLSSLRARLQTNSVAFDDPGLNAICFPDSIRFQNLSTGGEFYVWDLGDGTTYTKSDTNSFVHAYQSEGSYLVKLKAIDVNTCIGVDSAAVLVHVFSTEMKAQDDDVMCYGTNYQLQASGGVSYAWRTQDGPLASALVSPEESTLYYETITDANGCKRKDEVNLDVVPGIDVAMEYEFVTDCFSRPQLRVRNITPSSANETYLIDFGDGFTTDLPEAIHSYEQDNSYTVRVLGIREFCVYENPVNLPVYTLRVPNVITPEGADGFNDRFVIQYGEQGLSPADAGFRIALRIYNRWGNPVYESTDYQNDWNASDVDGGIYYYTVSMDGFSMCRSWLHVVK